MHYETPYVNYTIPGNFFGDVVFKDELSVKPLAPDIPLPSYAHPTDAGLDLHAISVEAPGTVIVATCIIQPGMTAKVHTGIASSCPTAHSVLSIPAAALPPKPASPPPIWLVSLMKTIPAKSSWPYITTVMNLRRSPSGIVSPSWSSSPLSTAPSPRSQNSPIPTVVADLSEVQENSDAQVLSYELLLGFR